MNAVLDWAQAKLWAFVRTFVAVSVPFVLQYLDDRASVDIKAATSMVAMTLIIFVVTSLREIPDAANSPAWQVLLWRFLRQFGQVLGAAIGTAVLVTDISWGPTLVTALVSAFATVILGSYVVKPDTVVQPAVVHVENFHEAPEVHGSSELAFPEGYAPERAIE